MKFYWNEEKNEMLKNTRNVCFEDGEKEIKQGSLLDERPHTNNEKYPHQRIFILYINSYTYIIPYVYQKNSDIFLKTIIPSRIFQKEFFPYTK